MVPILLRPFLHQNKECLGLFFAHHPALEKLVRRKAAAKWSQSHRCWYILLSEEGYQQLTLLLKTIAIMDTTELKQYLIKKKHIVSILQDQNTPAIAPTARPQKMAAAKSKAWKLSNENLQALDDFVNGMKLRAYSPSTINTYRNEFTQLLQLLKHKRAENLTAADIKRYMLFAIEKEGISENTAHSRLNALKFYYEQVLGKEKFFFDIPRPKKPRQLPKVISEEKIIEGIFSVDNLKHRSLLLLAYSAGMRVSEVVKLKLTDINSDRMQIAITCAKGKKDRVVNLSVSILPILRNYYQEYKPASWLFEGQNAGEHYSSRSAQLIFKAAYKKMKLPPGLSFHSLRHSYATHLLENGTDISYIQKLLGHNDIKTTLRYASVSNKDIGRIESPLDKIMRKKGT